MKEAEFWNGCFKWGMEKACPGIHMNRIENLAGVGIADVNMCYKGREAWVELKMFRGAGEWIDVRTSQLSWHSKRVLAGGRCFFVCRKHFDIMVYNSTTVIQLSQNPEYVKGADGKSLALLLPMNLAIRKFHKPFNWEAMRDFLFGMEKD